LQGARQALRHLEDDDLGNVVLIAIRDAEIMPVLPGLEQPNHNGRQDAEVAGDLARILE
jgi:hypothetical protein